MAETTNTFDQWCIVELFGHTKIAGKVTEQVIGGQSFVRVDVPETDSQLPFTKLYGSGAIYCMSPCSEDVARAALKRIHLQPISVWVPVLEKDDPKKLVSSNPFEEDDDERDEY